MDKLNLFDIQGFVARGYNFPHAAYLILEICAEEAGREFVGRVTHHVTSAEPWAQGKKPCSTVNVGFTWDGFRKLGMPDATLISFPVEFCQGMQSRNAILGDVGRNDPSRWESVWQGDNVHVWLAIHALDTEELARRIDEMQRLMQETGGARLLYTQQAGSIAIDGKPSPKEHFGYTDGFGNPDFAGVERKTVPGQGKLMPDGSWARLATGEFLLGYADEAQELAACPVLTYSASTALTWHIVSCTRTSPASAITWIRPARYIPAEKKSSRLSSSAGGATARRSRVRPTARTWRW